MTDAAVSPTPRRRWRLVALALTVAAVGGAAAWARARPLSVTVTPTVRGTAIEAVYATGTVEAEERVVVKAKTNGSLAEVLVREGQPVKRGDLLARIDNPVAAFELKRGQAELSAASAQASADAPQIAALKGQRASVQADLDHARRERERVASLAGAGAVSSAELDRIEARVRQFEAALASNEAQQRALRIDLSANAQRQSANVQALASRLADAEVRAPLDGVVLSRNVEVGEVVGVNQPLFRVGDTRRLVLEVSIDEADVARVRDGREGAPASVAAVSLHAFAGQAFKASVFEIYPDANRERKAFLAKLRLDAPPAGLRSGMTVEVNVITREKPGAVLMPAEALADGAVWVVAEGRASRRQVTVGLRDLLRVEALSGLAEGDAVVVEGQAALTEGRRVKATLRPDDRLKPLPDASEPGKTSIR